LTESCWPVQWIPELPTASGWEPESNPSDLAPPEQPPVIVTTRIPQVVNVQTDTAPKTTQKPSANTEEETGRDFTHQEQTAVIFPTYEQPGNVLTVPAPHAQQIARNPLLSSIVEQLGNSQVRTQQPEPAPFAATPVSKAIGVENKPAQQQITHAADITSAENAVALGGVITLGSATLALTPGLSTTVGSGSDATMVAITTDVADQTFITISSSGTAVTATVSDTPATITLPKTGFDASITEAARPGTWSTFRAAEEVAPTSSKGEALGRRAETCWWVGALLSLVGYGALL
jgi:hypothetical protein